MRYDIFNHKPGVEGSSPLNPESPINETAVTPKPKRNYKALLRYGEMMAQRAYSTITQEVRLGGNERLADTLNFLSRASTTATMAVASGGTSLIPEAINATAQTVQTFRQNARENRNSEYQRELQGSRINFNQGRIYYD